MAMKEREKRILIDRIVKVKKHLFVTLPTKFEEVTGKLLEREVVIAALEARLKEIEQKVIAEAMRHIGEDEAEIARRYVLEGEVVPEIIPPAPVKEARIVKVVKAKSKAKAKAVKKPRKVKKVVAKKYGEKEEG